MDINLTDLPGADCYKLLSALIIPRPIAWVSTLGESGVANCAPFSFFNLVSGDPPLCIIGINARADGSLKDTLLNIRRTKEFVLNLVDEDLAKAMRVTGNEFPDHVSEFEQAGLTPAPSVRVRHPRIAQAPASLECVVNRLIPIHAGQELILADIVHLHAREGIIDPATLRTSLAEYRPIGRLFASHYCTTRERFDLPGEVPPRR